MKRLPRNTGWLTALVVLCGMHGIANGDETPRQFDIELLIFRNLVENDAGEIWPPDYSGWFDASALTASEPAGGALPQAVDWLPNEAHRLSDEYYALRRSSGYRPLAYLAWRQPVAGRATAQALPVSTERHERDGSYVDGTVTVAVERYLHLALDLQLHLPDELLPAAPDADVDADAVDNVDTPGSEPGEVAPARPAIRLTEQRRVRSRELHFFDNPRFGVIALITPYEPPPEIPEVVPDASPETDTESPAEQAETAP
jgi:hypothetical protein